VRATARRCPARNLRTLAEFRKRPVRQRIQRSASHIETGSPEIQVFDIWESQEALNAFAATLVPALKGLGVELSEPMVSRVHNVIEGELAKA